jgi:hypothetical protein
MIIKPVLLISMFLISTGMVLASTLSTPCPTCPKSYVASRLEEVLITRQKSKILPIKKKQPLYTPAQNLGMTISPNKTPAQIVAQLSERPKFSSRNPSYRSPKDFQADKEKARTLLHPPTQGLADIVRRDLNWQAYRK